MTLCLDNADSVTNVNTGMMNEAEAGSGARQDFSLISSCKRTVQRGTSGR